MTNESTQNPKSPLSKWLLTMVFVAMGASFALMRTDLLIAAEYRVGHVQEVQQVAGADVWDRLVIVDLGDFQRALRTSDWLIQTELGQPVCVRRASYLLRRWVRHSLALPGYCPALRAAFNGQPSA